MDKDLNEYESLRNEIISMEEQQRNVWIYMYVLFSTMFVLGIEWSYYIFLVTYIVIIPFQIIINSYKYFIHRISAYIRIFYESQNKNLNWESLQIFYEYKKYEKELYNTLSYIIRKTGAIQLGFLATCSFNFFLLYSKYDNGSWHIKSIDFVFIFVSVILLFVTIIINIEYDKDYINELDAEIKKYKKYIDENNEKDID